MDLDKLSRAKSPLNEDEAHLCPTVMAGLTMAEFHISTNNLQSARMHIWMAASKGSVFARAMATRLEPYDSPGINTDVIDVANYPSSIDTTLAGPPVRTMMWAYESACSGSVTALQQLRSGDEIIHERYHRRALETLRKCRLGGIQHLEMWSMADKNSSREAGIVQAAPTELEELTVQMLIKEDKLRLWVEDGPRVGEDISALHVACAKGLSNIVRKLLAEGANVNSRLSPQSETPLLLATISGCLEIVRTLLDHGADPCLADGNDQMPIHFLSSFDDEDIPTAATLLCKRKSQLSAVADASITFAEGHTLELGLGSGTPLHRAVGKRNVKAVTALLELGADPMAKDCVGVTTIGFAARFHLVNILSLLRSSFPNYKPNINHGPNMRLFNFATNCASPIDLFNIHGVRWRENTKSAIKLLLDFGESLYGYRGEDHFLRNAIAEGQDVIAEVLLENGATDYMEKFDHEFSGMPCLYEALNFGRRANFTSLLKHGANVRTLYVPSSIRQPGAMFFPDNRSDQSTYLHVCSEIGSDVFFVREFIRRGVPINQPDSEWHTAFYLALKAGYHQIAEELLKAGAMLNEVLDGLTLLGQLATEGFGLPKARFQWLLDKTPDNQVLKFLGSQRHRQSVFHLFAQDQRAIRQPAWARDLLEFFLHQVNDKRLLDLQDTDLNTAIHLAVKSNNIETIRSLLDAGASPNLENYEGKTPLALSKEISRWGNKEIIALLEDRSAKGLTPSMATKVNAEAAMKLWTTLGLPEYVDEWMDTALVGVLQELRSQLLAFFRSEDFFQVDNPWTPVTRMIHACVSTNTAIVDKEQRTRDFEYGLSQMLFGFVDAVTIELQNKGREDNQLFVQLVKPLDRQTRQMPAGLLRSNVLLPSYAPGIKATTYQSRGNDSRTPQQSMSSPKPETPSSSARGKLISMGPVNPVFVTNSLTSLRTMD
jgi:ankyrin repeat protein